MLTGALLGGALAAGVPVRVLAVLGFGAYRPGLFLAGCACWGAVARWRTEGRPGPDDEARFLRAMSAELTAGASLRFALASAAERAPQLDLSGAVRRAVAGRPIRDVAETLREALPANGRLAGPALVLAAETGGRSAPVFGGLAVRAAEHGELARERRALTAQTRLSAAVVAGAPLALAAVVVATGGFSTGGLGGASALVIAAGVALEAAGAGAVWWMIRRAAR